MDENVKKIISGLVGLSQEFTRPVDRTPASDDKPSHSFCPHCGGKL